MEVAIQEVQKMEKAGIWMKEPLEEESEICVVEVDQVPWRGVRRNDRDESEGSCERLASRKGRACRVREVTF